MKMPTRKSFQIPRCPGKISWKSPRFHSNTGKAGCTLKNIDLKIQRGDFITVLGANGSGKTTLMKLIAGILDAKEGDILYQGRSLKKFPVAGKVGYVYHHVRFVEVTRFHSNT